MGLPFPIDLVPPISLMFFKVNSTQLCIVILVLLINMRKTHVT